MITLHIKLNDGDQSFEISAREGGEVLSAVRGNYQKDLADKLIQGISDLTDQYSNQPAIELKKSGTCSERFMVTCGESVRASGVEPSRTKTSKGLDKKSVYVRLKKRGKFRVYYDESSKSFVSNLIGNSVAGIVNWLDK